MVTPKGSLKTVAHLRGVQLPPNGQTTYKGSLYATYDDENIVEW